eukprot:TRINITY_DN32825_c0_g1_i2.p1 TRINITY_DN32825_c0_g1~~TRINITY_DN32825_c0_g1_i2.p1  ORF type:complete len:650 (+),score=148.66 TRINITY_DN32825_c0_g1_i2:86-1951(+)
MLAQTGHARHTRWGEGQSEEDYLSLWQSSGDQQRRAERTLLGASGAHAGRLLRYAELAGVPYEEMYRRWAVPAPAQGAAPSGGPAAPPPPPRQAARLRQAAELSGVPYEELVARWAARHSAAPAGGAPASPPPAANGTGGPRAAHSPDSVALAARFGCEVGAAEAALAAAGGRCAGAERALRGAGAGGSARRAPDRRASAACGPAPGFVGTPGSPVENLCRRHGCSRATAEAALLANHMHAGLASRAISQRRRLSRHSVHGSAAPSARRGSCAPPAGAEAGADSEGGEADEEDQARSAQRERRHFLNREVWDGEHAYHSGVLGLADEYLRPLAELLGADPSRRKVALLVSDAARALSDIAASSAQLIADMGAAIDSAQEASTSAPASGRSSPGGPGDFSNVDFSNAFERLGPLLRLYTPFLAGYQPLQDRLREVLTQRPDAAALADRAEAVLQARLPGDCSLFGLLITPIQRLMRYRLLLSQLLKQALHPDSGVPPETVSGLQHTLADITDRVAWCNDYCTASEKRREVRAQERQQASASNASLWKRLRSGTKHGAAPPDECSSVGGFFPDGRRVSFQEAASAAAALLRLNQLAHGLSVQAGLRLLRRYWAALSAYRRSGS